MLFVGGGGKTGWYHGERTPVPDRGGSFGFLHRPTEMDEDAARHTAECETRAR